MFSIVFDFMIQSDATPKTYEDAVRYNKALLNGKEPYRVLTADVSQDKKSHIEAKPKKLSRAEQLQNRKEEAQNKKMLHYDEFNRDESSSNGQFFFDKLNNLQISHV